jgi:rhodanese-related sulfurtransferase
MKRVLPMVIAGIMLGWVTAVPADDPDVPEKYMKVDEAKALLDQQKPLVFVDVRPKSQFDIVHIKGAVNIPLQELNRRLAEVPDKDLVLLY